MKNIIKKNILAILCTVCIIIFPFIAIKNVNGAYNFNENSGLKTTAEKTGHTEIGIDKPETMISTIIEVFISFLGVFFLILIIYAGYTRMTAKGNKDEVNKSNTILKGALIGLMIVISAYIISTFILKSLGGKTLKNQTSMQLII